MASKKGRAKRASTRASTRASSRTSTRAAPRRAGVPSVAASVIKRLIAGSPALPETPLEAVIARLVRGAPALPDLQSAGNTSPRATTRGGR